ncbi:class I SAM-dependent methyltransferase [Paludifilum halophilum]|uniref:16S rRNA methyltransferase n=1 Tax=Paludifilum halophilum TaxID=1642702 RepID=A0A235B3Q7_9BACL|nr:class I SAM-dependent methyltransferase [Paludifilum halophilum]OYD06547.1 16S rRNA methyltransferase [Paludifilum halophilum]
MTDHYFSSRPDSAEAEREIEARLRGRFFRFRVDTGVFSKKGVDFGTRLLIETAKLPKQGEILDLGCGYGPVGIACAVSSPNSRVTMVDVNLRALELAQKNARLNGVESQVEIRESDGLTNLNHSAFDAILTNPPIRAGKNTVYRLFEEAAKGLKPDGQLWVVIRKQQGAPSAKEKLEKIFSHVELLVKKKGFWILRSKNKIDIDTGKMV